MTRREAPAPVPNAFAPRACALRESLVKSQAQIVVAGKIDVDTTADFEPSGIPRNGIGQVPPETAPAQTFEEVLISAFAPTHDPVLALALIPSNQWLGVP
ncbi:MAG: hypothetical protein A49_08810 [Methyloceanibacter sp.]|nr:MAG: hypothetical protein A49_08810 [Methyloceanibacter sp.]